MTHLTKPIRSSNLFSYIYIYIYFYSIYYIPGTTPDISSYHQSRIKEIQMKRVHTMQAALPTILLIGKLWLDKLISDIPNTYI